MYIIIFSRKEMILKAGKLISKSKGIYILEDLNSGAISSYESKDMKYKEFSSLKKIKSAIADLKGNLSVIKN